MNVDKAMEIINQIAAKLGVAAEYIAPELARLKITEGIIGIASSVIVLGLVYMAITKALKYLRYLNDDDKRSWVDKSDMQIGCIMLIAFMGIVGVFAAFAFFRRNQRIERMDHIANSEIHRICDEGIKAAGIERWIFGNAAGAAQRAYGSARAEHVQTGDVRNTTGNHRQRGH